MINADEPAHRSAPLDLQTNPFASSAPSPVNPAQMLAEVMWHIALERRAIVVSGTYGSGKTSLVKLISRSCSDMGLSVRRFDRGDLVDPAVDAQSDVVLVDDADSVPDSAVLMLLSPDPITTATTWLLMCRPASVDRFRCLDADVVELRGLSVDDARTYLLERATSIGRPDLFAPDALDMIVHQARGSPGLLLSVANLAFLTAAWGGAKKIGVRHVAYWLKSTSFEFVEDGAAPFRIENANGSKAKHRSGFELDVYRSAPGPEGDGPKVRDLLPEGVLRVPRGRALRWNGAFAASIVLAGAVVAFSLGGNDTSVGTSVTVPTVADIVAPDVSLDQTAAAANVSPDIQASPARDAAEAPSVNPQAENLTAVPDHLNPNPAGQSSVASKRTRPPTPVKTSRAARAPGASLPPAAKKALHRTRHAVQVASQTEDLARRTAELAVQAQHAARRANDAARRADQAARRADRAASRAERAARLANWTIRLQFPRKAIAEPRSAS